MVVQGSGLTVTFRYLSSINWSLVWAGIPFVLELRVRAEVAPREALVFELSLDPYLKPTALRVTPDDVREGCDLSGELNNHLRSHWNWLASWNLDRPRAGRLRVRLPGGDGELPVELFPPTYWHRVIDRARGWGRHLSTSRVAWRPAAGERITVEPGELRWRDDFPYPPLETALAALIDPDDPWSRRDGSEGALGRRVGDTWRIQRADPKRQLEVREPEPEDVLKALYTALLHWPELEHLDHLTEYPSPDVQAVRMLREERLRGALCLDLVCQGCEVLLGWGCAPLFVLVEEGRHAILGVRKGGLDPAESEEGPLVLCGEAFTERARGDAILLLDLTLALGDESYEDARASCEWSAVATGFCWALDVRRARRWAVEDRTFSIPPFPRPTDAGCLRGYVRGLPSELLEQRDADADGSIDAKPGLDDPSTLYVPLACTPAGETSGRPVLARRRDPGWVWETVVERAGRAAILADGGAGKTYLSRRLALDLAQRHADDGDEVSLPLPLFFPLRLLGRSQGLLDAVARYVGCRDRHVLTSIAEERRLLFLLDALDESDYGRAATSPRDYRRLFEELAELPLASVLLTARPALFPGEVADCLPGFAVARLQGWGEDELADYLQVCETEKDVRFEDGWRRFHRRIYGPGAGPHLRDLARTPLYARMIVESRREIEAGGEGLRNEYDLYRLYTRRSFARRREYVRIDLAIRASREIALSIHLRSRDALQREEIAQDLAVYLSQVSVTVWREVLRNDYIVHGLLSPEGEDLLRFSHLSIRDFFLAERLAGELKRPPRPGRVSGLFAHTPLDHGVLRFLAQICRHNGWCRRQLEDKLTTPAEGRRSLLVGAKRTEGRLDPDTAFRNLVLIHTACGGHLRAADLRRLDLSNADLSGTDLTGADLRRATLRGCHLGGARFDGGDLRYGDLRDTDLTGTSLRKTSLAGCKLGRCHVTDAALPRLCQACHLAELDLEPGDRRTISLLLQAIAGEELEPACAEWAEQARRDLHDLAQRLGTG